MVKEIASSFIFGGNTNTLLNQEHWQILSIIKCQKRKIYRNIGFDITEMEAKKILGDDAMGKALLSAWRKWLRMK